MEQRKRFSRVESPNHARFLTFSTFGRLPLFGNDAIKDRFAAHLASARSRDGFGLFAWVVMPEHVHLVVFPRDTTVSSSLIGMKGRFAREIIGRWRELDAKILTRLKDAKGKPRFWQHGGGYDRVVRDEDELREKINYIHNNPVKRGLAERPTDWKWSSARWYAGEREGTLEIDRW